jgi:hypothetical protein
MVRESEINSLFISISGADIAMHQIMMTLLTLFLSGHIAFTQAVPPDQRLEMSVTDGSYIFGVPVSTLTLTIPKGDLAPDASNAGSTGPRYFHLQGKSSGLNISGWFEPEPAFKGIKPFWEGELAGLRKGKLPEPQNVSFLDVGNWKTIWYDIKAPGGYDSNVRAEWVQDGTWIDLHLSMAANLSASDIRAKLLTYLNSIHVSVK